MPGLQGHVRPGRVRDPGQAVTRLRARIAIPEAEIVTSPPARIAELRRILEEISADHAIGAETSEIPWEHARAVELEGEAIDVRRHVAALMTWVHRG